MHMINKRKRWQIPFAILFVLMMFASYTLARITYLTEVAEGETYLGELKEMVKICWIILTNTERR